MIDTKQAEYVDRRGRAHNVEGLIIKPSQMVTRKSGPLLNQGPYNLAQFQLHQWPTDMWHAFLKLIWYLTNPRHYGTYKSHNPWFNIKGLCMRTQMNGIVFSIWMRLAFSWEPNRGICLYTMGVFLGRPLVHQILVWMRTNPPKCRGNMIGWGLYVSTSYSHFLNFGCTYYNMIFVMSPSVMSLPLLYSKTVGNGCARYKPPLCCHIFLSYITSYDIKISHQRVQTTHSHASHGHHYHYCNVALCVIP